MDIGKLSVGRTVRLMAGGPPMTVDRIDEANITCLWFEQTEGGYGKLNGSVFRASVLEEAVAAPQTETRTEKTRGAGR